MDHPLQSLSRYFSLNKQVIDFNSCHNNLKALKLVAVVFFCNPDSGSESNLDFIDPL